jgi:hypothetical protein
MDYEYLSRNGLLLARDLTPHLGSDRALKREVDAGRLVKVRRGAYVEAKRWASADDREKHLLRVRAAAVFAVEEPIVAGVSAAALWGMPIHRPFPTDVTFLCKWIGGGRSEPGVRKSTRGFSTARIVRREGVLVTCLSRTVIEIARSSEFSDAMGSIDWARRRHNESALSLDELQDDLRTLAPRADERRVRAMVEFSTTLSDSFGESRGRAVIHLLGFTPPDLQVEFRDRDGVIRPDFYWPSVGIAAEFDGKVKYTRDEYTGGDPSQVVWREKQREDRLRRLTRGVVRFTTADVSRPDRLARLLDEAGVPRR